LALFSKYKSVGVNLRLSLFLVFIFSCVSLSAESLQKVTLQLKWTHAFQFAGYYAAKEQGYYKEAGLDVEILEASSLTDPVEEVVRGKAQYGVGTSSLLLAHERGKPVVVLAAIFQHSPYEIHTSSDIFSLKDLLGKRLMMEPHSDELLAYLQVEGILLKQIKLLVHSFNPQDLIDGKTDAMSGYISNEPFYYKNAKYSFNTFSPRSVGIDFYGDNLFTSTFELQQHPQRVKKFREASMRGWKYAKEHSDELIELIQKKYAPRLSSEHLKYESDRMIPLLQPDLVEIGYMNPSRWQHIADTYVSLGLIAKSYTLNDFVYDPNQQILPEWISTAFMLSFIIFLLVLAWLFYFVRANKRLKESQTELAKHEHLVENISSEYCFYIHDNEGIITYVSPSIIDFLGYTPEEVKKNYSDFVTDHPVNKQIHEFTNAALKGDKQETYLTQMYHKDGSKIWIEVTESPVFDHQGSVIGIEGVMHNITKLQESELQLKLAATVFTNANEGIMITDAYGTIVDVNEAYELLSGYSREYLLGQNAKILSSELQSEEFYLSMWNKLTEDGYWGGELWNQRKNGDNYAQLLSISAVFDEIGTVMNYIVLVSDITAIKEHQNQLESIAHYDGLTGLPNRLLLVDRLSLAISHTNRQENLLAVCMIDLDGFKGVNDTLGHNAGDTVLIEVAQRMQKVIRSNDTVARLGGDEFVIILTDVGKIDDCAIMLYRLLNAIAQPYIIADQEVNTISASIGVSIYPDDKVDSEMLLRHADIAMYEAKNSGKNRFNFFNVSSDKKIKANHKTLNKIKTALEKGEFCFYFQPKINVRYKTVIEIEALIRWAHPLLGLMSPAEFLPLIENNEELSNSFDAWVIKAGILQLDAWQKEGIFVKLCVNISPKQFKQKNFTEKLKQLIEQNNLDLDLLSYLEFEILETAAVEHLHNSNNVIKECKELGITFALDDFGTGYSSLMHLKDLAVNTIKIDKSFVQEMLENPQSMAIVKSIIGLANAFDISVTAEGVQTMEQILSLMEIGCDEIQGYAITHPLEKAEMKNFLLNFTPDPRWKMVAQTLPSKADFELLIAKANHKFWIESAMNELAQEEMNETIFQTTHAECKFARWFEKVKKQNFAVTPHLQELDLLHQKIHENVTMLYLQIQKEHRSITEEEKISIESMSEKVMSLIDTIENKNQDALKHISFADKILQKREENEHE
jgi:diguanylate cyclase (GGDEF)-like protein/PAS domain S-box-containing protein